jgi:hypothetical protein
LFFGPDYTTVNLKPGGWDVLDSYVMFDKSDKPWALVIRQNPFFKFTAL